MRTVLKSLLLGSVLLSCTACYRMPTDDDYSVVPMTNSPDFKREGTPALMPNTSY